MLNIVVVEDHHVLRDITVEALKEMGHAVVGLDCAEKLDDQLGTCLIDLLVIDLNLPGEDGLSLARRIRAAQPEIGIIMVTARTQVSDRVVGYDHGADIYLTKPTSLDELGAAVNALARRLTREEESGYRLVSETLTLHGPTGAVGLSAQGVSILAALARAPGKRLESWQLLEIAGASGTAFNKATLEVQIVRLRKKIIQVGSTEQPIKSLRGWGYQLCVPLTLS